MKKTKNGFPSSYWEDKDRCPSCGNFCNLDTDIDEFDCCNDCRETDSKNVEVTTKQQTAMQELKEDLIETKYKSLKVLDKINEEEKRIIAKQVLRTAIDRIIQRIDMELLTMEKEQKIDFARHCLNKAKDLDILTSFMNVEQYYNETFKN